MIEDNVATYKPLTEEDLKDGLEAIGLRQQLDPRKMVVYTGLGGARAIDRAIRINGLTFSTEMLLKDNNITQHEHDRLMEMLNGKDDRDFTLAETIIDKKYELNI